MAKSSHRVFALVLAVLFLATSLATGVAVVWRIYEDGQQSQTNKQTKMATSKDKSEEGKLQGTKLEDFDTRDKVEKLEIIDLKKGDGEEVKPGATVTAHYTGAIAKTGIIFQSSHDTGDAIEFPLDGVIKGWTEGVPGMKVGGKRRLIIPASKAYGENSPSPDIPANADLVFDIEMVSVKNP